MKDSLPIVLFDPECPLCLRFKQGLEYLDKSIHFVSARNNEIYSHYPELCPQNCLEKVHLITEEKKILVGPDVVEYFVQRLPGISKFAWLLESNQGQKVKDFFYQKVEELREISLRKKSECDECPRD